MDISSKQEDAQHRLATLTSTKVRSTNDGPHSWSESERRIAVELIRKLVYGRASKLLVCKIKHATESEIAQAVAAGLGQRGAIKHTIELNEYVGLRLYQQRIIEQAFQDACAQVSVSVPS